MINPNAVVECVPNISEGKDRAIIDACAQAAAAIDGVTLLDVDAGADTNRTVITFAGSPDAVLEGAFQLIAESARRIDMSKHHGAHPRSGACDVCPFVPVSNIDLEGCAELARKLAERVGNELHLSGYLYEAAATSPERQNLADLRAGEYEALEAKMADPKWAPDFGPAVFNPKFGAMHIGARTFLGAYNINLNTRSKSIASDIALTIREKGRAARNRKGEIVRDKNGKSVLVPGLFKCCKAAGWYLDAFQQCQVTMNLTNMEITPLHLVFDKVEELAHNKGVRVTGSEIVGMIPLKTMLDAGKFFLKKQGRSTAVPDRELVRVAIESLGLNDFTPFDPQHKIVEYALEAAKNTGKTALKDLTLEQFTEEVASESPAPGGGSVSALVGALAASLTSMVANLTHQKKGFEKQQDKLELCGLKAESLRAKLIKLIDEDTKAFNGVIEAIRMPKGTDAEIAARTEAMAAANLLAANVPYRTARCALNTFDLIAEMISKGNQNSLSDVGVANLCALTCAQGGALNIKINLPSLSPSDRLRYGKAADAILEDSMKRFKKNSNALKKRLLALVQENITKQDKAAKEAAKKAAKDAKSAAKTAETQAGTEN